jgi:hypothetical protein
MDEEDGKPGACSRQLGYSNAPAGVPPQSLFKPISNKNLRAPSFRDRYERHPSGAKAPQLFCDGCGTTEVVPFHAATEQVSGKVSPSSEERPVAKATLNQGPLFGRLKPPAPSEKRETSLQALKNRVFKRTVRSCPFTTRLNSLLKKPEQKTNSANDGLAGAEAGAEARLILLTLSARLKSCSFTRPASPLRGFAAISHPYPTLKRGANNRCAYGALGTTEVVPFHDGTGFIPFRKTTFTPVLRSNAR